MKGLRRRLRGFASFIRNGPFGKSQPIRFDRHTAATTGPDLRLMDFQEDAADNYASAMSDRNREIIYLAERRR